MNFELAYRRVCDELAEQPKSGRAFVQDPFAREMVETELSGWLEELEASVAAGSYGPTNIEACGAPKGGDLIRPAARMALADRVVYTAAVGSCLPAVVDATRWSQRTIDFAPLFHATKPFRRDWLLKPFLGWEGWTARSLHLFDLSRTTYVVTADIAGFFENISRPRLKHDLTRIGAADDIVELLSRCLRKWSLIDDRGIPQGVLASDILAKLYMESFDKRLKDEGYAHVRYADDIRVFCRSNVHARSALVLITELLRERGLTLQSAKTRIRPAGADLRVEIEGAIPAIRDLNRDFIDDAIDAGLLPVEQASVPVSVIDDLIDVDPADMDPEVLRRAWREYVEATQNPNRSMYRYLLRRFATTRDRIAVRYCSPRLRTHPEELTEVLRYFEALGDTKLELPIARALASRDLRPYPFSRYLLLEWLRNRQSLRAPTLKAVREQAFGDGHPGYVQASARAVLGAMGQHSDLDRLAAMLAGTIEPFARAQLMCTLTRLEQRRRNGIASDVKNEGPWGRRAWAYVRASK